MIFRLSLSSMSSSKVLANPYMNAFHWSHAKGSGVKSLLSWKAGWPGRDLTCGKQEPGLWCRVQLEQEHHRGKKREGECVANGQKEKAE